jgi:hypothetical protein
MKSLLTASSLMAALAFATASFAGPGDARSFPYGPVPMFTAQTGPAPEGAPYALTGNTNTTSDALRPNTFWIGGSRDMHTGAAFQNAR